MVQTEGERRQANREQKQRSRKRSKINAYWRGEFGDIETARAMLAADDAMAEKFGAESDEYPWDERDTARSVAAGSPLVPYDTACEHLGRAPDEAPVFTSLETEARQARAGGRDEDIDAAEAGDWYEMQREACKAMAKAKRSMWKGGEPYVLDHVDEDCPRCGMKKERDYPGR